MSDTQRSRFVAEEDELEMHGAHKRTEDKTSPEDRKRADEAAKAGDDED